MKTLFTRFQLRNTRPCDLPYSFLFFLFIITLHVSLCFPFILFSFLIHSFRPLASIPMPLPVSVPFTNQVKYPGVSKLLSRRENPLARIS